MVQIKCFDLDNKVVVGGMIMDNNDLICCCCGNIIPKEEISISDETEYDSSRLEEKFKKVYSKEITSKTQFRIDHIYKTWINLTEIIIDE